MADNVQLPADPDAPVTMSTDEVDLGEGLAHVTHGKIVDGRPGRIRPLAVAEAKGMPTERLCVSFSSSVTVGETSYADYEVLGGAIELGPGGGGLYRLEQAYAFMVNGSSFVSPFPAPVHLAFGWVNSSVPLASVVTDGYAMSGAPPEVLPSIVVADPAKIEAHPFNDALLITPNGLDQPIVSMGPAGLFYSQEMVLWGFVVADGAIAADLSGNDLYVRAVLSRVGDDSTLTE